MAGYDNVFRGAIRLPSVAVKFWCRGIPRCVDKVRINPLHATGGKSTYQDPRQRNGRPVGEGAAEAVGRMGERGGSEGGDRGALAEVGGDEGGGVEVRGTGMGRVVRWNRKARVNYVHCRTGKGNLQAWGHVLDDSIGQEHQKCGGYAEMQARCLCLYTVGRRWGTWEDMDEREMWMKRVKDQTW